MAVANPSSMSLGEALLSERVISRAQLQSALEAQKESSHSIGRVLVELGHVTEGMRAAVLQKTFGFDQIDLSRVKADPAVASLIPVGFALKHHILPVRKEGKNTLVVAMEDPSDAGFIEAVEGQVGLKLKMYIAGSEEIASSLRSAYGSPAASAEIEAPPSTKPEHGLSYRILRAWAFPLMCFAPLLTILVLTVFVGPFQRWLLESENNNYFDIVIYTTCLWALWAIILYEVNALIFKVDEDDEAEEE